MSQLAFYSIRGWMTLTHSINGIVFVMQFETSKFEIFITYSMCDVHSAGGEGGWLRCEGLVFM